jgi:hypothetical protein
MEGAFGDGRKASVCGSPASRWRNSAESSRSPARQGYKIFAECGVQGLTDRSRRPYRYAHQLPFQVENYILNVKREHTTWGAHSERSRPSFSSPSLPVKGRPA